MKRGASYLWGSHPQSFRVRSKIARFVTNANISIRSRSIFRDDVTLTGAASTPRPPKAIASPCVMVCAVDGDSGLCLGCFRTLKEIAGWRALSDAERTAVMADLPLRRGRVDPAKLGE